LLLPLRTAFNASPKLKPFKDLELCGLSQREWELLLVRGAEDGVFVAPNGVVRPRARPGTGSVAFLST
jgi:hypothetical protein